MFLISGDMYTCQFLSRRFLVQLFSFEFSLACTVRPSLVAFPAAKRENPKVITASAIATPISLRKLITETI